MLDPLVALSFYYPEVAIALLEGARLLPIIIPIDLRWDAETGTQIGAQSNEGSARTALAVPAIIHQIVYDVERPNANVGNVLGAQEDFFLAQTPYVDCSIRLASDRQVVRYTLDVSPTALPLLAAPLHEAWPCGWLLEGNQNPIVQGTLTRALVDDDVPFKIRIGLRGFQLLDPQEIFRTMLRTDAADVRVRCVSGLKKLGLAA